VILCCGGLSVSVTEAGIAVEADTEGSLTVTITGGTEPPQVVTFTLPVSAVVPIEPRSVSFDECGISIS